MNDELLIELWVSEGDLSGLSSVKKPTPLQLLIRCQELLQEAKFQDSVESNNSKPKELPVSKNLNPPNSSTQPLNIDVLSIDYK